MKRTAISMCLVLLLLPSTIGAAGPTIVLDQIQAVVDYSVGGLGVGDSCEQRLAQTITAGFAGQLIGVMLPISCESGHLIVEIRDVVDGKPGPTLLSQASFPALSIPYLGPTTFQFIPIANDVSFSAGDQFSIEISNPTGSCGISRGPVGDTYSDGQGFFEALPNPPGWIPFSETGDRLDLPFMTVVRILPEPGVLPEPGARQAKP